MAENHLAKMALCRSPRPLAWYLVSRQQAVCPACLGEDEAGDRDHYVRRSWAHIEAVVCSRHGEQLLDICGRCFSRAGFRFHCVEGRARLVCAACSTVVTRVALDKTSPERMEFLLDLSGEISAAVDAQAPGSNIKREEIMRAALLLWTPSQADNKPFIAWSGLGLPTGRHGMPAEQANPLATVSLAWRIPTLIGIAQLLNLVDARQRFGPPPAFLQQAFVAGPEKGTRSASKSTVPPFDETGKPATRIKLRSDTEYHALAEKILTSPEWERIQSAGAAARDRMLGRLMSQALDRAPRGQAAALDRAAP